MKVVYKGKELPVELKAGDVIMFRNGLEWNHPSTYLSTAIRIATKFPYNHSGIITESNGQLYINEALFEGIVKRPLSEGHLERGKKTVIAVLRPKLKVGSVQISTEADKYIGTPYDINALVVHHLLYRIARNWTGSTNQFAIGKLVCSEYVQLVHRRPDFWKASTREVCEDSFYDLIWEEVPLIKK